MTKKVGLSHKQLEKANWGGTGQQEKTTSVEQKQS